MGVSVTFNNLNRDEAKIATNYMDAFLALDDVRDLLRNRYKYGEYKHQETESLIDEIYAEFFEIVSARGVDLSWNP